MQNATLSSTSGQNEQGATGGGGGPGVHGRRRSGHRGAELGHKTDRGGRDEHDGGLTSGGGRRQRPIFGGQPPAEARFSAGPAAARRGGNGSGFARLGNEAASRKVRAPFIGRESLGGGAVQAGHGGGLWPVAGWAPPGQAAGPAWAGRAGAGRAHGLGPGR
jgi:hypothetical protein